ncbi:DUF3090 domain-containing protein [Nesterenkonia muleiensis]|uniref:DUF3090 domain-containing protein n=1 Tax=Nesterenkonia muleiensis TaxID=2282648 RepID=UPI000E73A6CF|nr:DUF3090 domain-containing protein [Nesterenkonia muleiensis]
MPTITHGFDWPDRFVVGTVGPPGSRTFYLQVRARTEILSVALEKQQSAALAEGIDEVLGELMAQEGNPFSVPSQTPEGLIDNEPLEQPVQEQFRVGALSLGWDPSTAQIVIEAVPVQEADTEEPAHTGAEPEEVLVVRIPVGAARAFAKRTREVVEAGRPLCPLCHLPMDSSAHVCEPPDEFR